MEIDCQVIVKSEPYTKQSFIGLLKCRGIRRNSRSWTEYELGKAIVRNLEDSDPDQSQYYDLYLSYLTSWLNV